MHTHTQGNKVQKFFWNKKEGGRVFHFGDVPFTVQEDRILDSLEIAISRAKSLRVRKIGCHAHVQYKTYTLYPEYAIREKDAVGLTKLALTTLRMQKLDHITNSPTKWSCQGRAQAFCILANHGGTFWSCYRNPSRFFSEG